MDGRTVATVTLNGSSTGPQRGPFQTTLGISATYERSVSPGLPA
jgi:hypothetical protein